MIERWHKVLQQKDFSKLRELLDDNVVFHSPVVHSPIQGKEMTFMYLSAAFHVLTKDFHYEREIINENTAVLEFISIVDDITINGVDMIEWNSDGKITDFKVMVRPLKAVNLIHQKMREMLESLRGETAQ